MKRRRSDPFQILLIPFLFWLFSNNSAIMRKQRAEWSPPNLAGSLYQREISYFLGYVVPLVQWSRYPELDRYKELHKFDPGWIIIKDCASRACALAGRRERWAPTHGFATWRRLSSFGGCYVTTILVVTFTAMHPLLVGSTIVLPWLV